MAEHVKRKMIAAKLGVSLAVLAFLAGLAERARSPETRVVADPAASVNPGKNSITSKQIKAHSLLYSDFKAHQVLSYKESVQRFHKLEGQLNFDEAALATLKLDSAALKGEVSSLKGEVASLKGELGGVLHGKGNVVLGTLSRTSNDPAAPLLGIPGLADVTASYVDRVAHFTITNTSGSPLRYAALGGPDTRGEIPAGQSQSFTGDLTVLELIPAVHTQITTLTLSVAGAKGDATGQLNAQALIGLL
jgi:hypothetical protein